ncbi:hypothetical protein [Deinococcus apachensis]|uniref:hypothetical protein n=1 Tax=Deinococcus apachensis TaxID=309886 RepID=UPI000380DA57|nr:hypothetical protein [Deinococcus apachensis]
MLIQVGLLVGLPPPSCAPSFQVGGETVRVLGGTAFGFVKSVEGDTLSPEALAARLGETCVTFQDCAGAGVSAREVRAVGLKAARDICVGVATRVRQAQEAFNVVRGIVLPALAVAAALFRFLLRALTFQA